MNTQLKTLLAAASAANAAAGDMIEAVRDGCITCVGNLGSGETTIALADSLHLLLDAVESHDDEDVAQLMGALARFLEGRI